MRYSLLFFLCFSIHSVHAQWTKFETDAYVLHRSQQALSDIIVHDVFSPPVASRIFAYANIGAYEVQAKNYKNHRSLAGRINEFTGIPSPQRNNISYTVASTYAFLQIGKRLVFSEDIMADSISTIMKWYTVHGFPEEIIQNSMVYGQAVADAILAYAAKDHYAETRKMRRYSFLKKEGMWQPTPPGYMAAVEPNWNKIRPFVMTAADQFRPAAPIIYSAEKSSPFYAAASEVYLTVKNLDKDQKLIASFWDCNPFFLNTNGHMNFATKKISPGAHWMSIAGIASQIKHADYMLSSTVYMYSSLALFDAFISCWDEKYRSNYIRPQTFINARIDENWQPILQTPPFPEYPSGHSVASTTVAEVLTALFGNDFSFDDDTETGYNLPVRRFSSFKAAANEAAISRLYGGIHFREAIVNGQKQGKELGDFIIEKFKINVE